MPEHEHHYLTRVWRTNTTIEATRLKEILNRNGIHIEMKDAKKAVDKFFYSIKEKGLVDSGSFVVTTQPYSGNVMQDLIIDPAYVIGKVIDGIIDGERKNGIFDTNYAMTIVVTNPDHYKTIDTCRLQMIYGFFDQKKNEIIQAAIGVVPLVR